MINISRSEQIAREISESYRDKASELLLKSERDLDTARLIELYEAKANAALEVAKTIELYCTKRYEF